METYLGYFDASVRGDHYYVGYIVFNQQQEPIISNAMKFWNNNAYSNTQYDSSMAEYLALLELLKALNRNKIKRIDIMSDNKCVVDQCTTKRRLKFTSRYKAIHAEIIALKSEMEHFSLQHVKRNKNKMADRLCRTAYKADKRREMVLCI